MPPLKNPRHEQFAQLLAQPQPIGRREAWLASGGKGRFAHQHAHRLLKTPAVAQRIAELQTKAADLATKLAARAEANAILKVEISRQSLLVDTVAAYKLAERSDNPQAMIAAVRLMAELSLISLKAPEDKPAAQQHLHLHDTGLIDRPPQESLEQWLDRKKQEADARATSKTLKIVGRSPDS